MSRKIATLIGAGIIGGGGAVDTTPPSVVITCAQTSPTKTSPLNYTFTFSEAVQNLLVGSIVVGNGTASNLAGSGSTRTFDVTPTAEGPVTVSLPEGSCTDLAGNPNVASSEFSINYYNYTVSLLHLDSDLTDVLGKTWTAENSAAIDTGNKKFGAGSLQTDRAASPKRIYTADNADFYFGSGAFTIDFWFKINSLVTSGYYWTYTQYVDANNLISLQFYHASGTALTYLWLNVKVSGSGVISLFFSIPTPISADGNFHHCELGRSGNNFYAFFDGTASASNPQADTDPMPDLAGNVYIGGIGVGTGLDGWFDEVRVSKGVCRHTSGFTPPSSPYP